MSNSTSLQPFMSSVLPRHCSLGHFESRMSGFCTAYHRQRTIHQDPIIIHQATTSVVTPPSPATLHSHRFRRLANICRRRFRLPKRLPGPLMHERQSSHSGNASEHPWFRLLLSIMPKICSQHGVCRPKSSSWKSHAALRNSLDQGCSSDLMQHPKRGIMDW